MFRADTQTYMTKITVAFCNFANTPKNCSELQRAQPGQQTNGPSWGYHLYITWW
jgi:hypothetical protein